MASQIADTLASFFPGIAMAMSKIATGDVKQGQSVTVVGKTLLVSYIMTSECIYYPIRLETGYN